MVRQPALVFGEVAWRWAFGAAAWTLVIIAIHRILARVDITQAELLIARRSDVFLIADACARIVVQVLPQLGRECLVLAPAIAVLWIAAATLGRAITLNGLVAEPVIRSEASRDFGDAVSNAPGAFASPPAARTHFGYLTLLHLLRAVFTLFALIAFFGALFLTGLAMPVQNPATGALVGILVAAVIAFFWSIMNWFLALAPIWIVRDGHTALRSIADSVDLYRRSPGPYAGIASWFGLLRGATFVAAFAAALIASQARPATSIVLCLVIALIYFAVADFLYVARLAAFVALDQSCQLSAISAQHIAPQPQWADIREPKADS